MVSFQTYALIQGMLFWNFCVDCYHTVSYYVSDLCSYLKQYYYNEHKIWLFFSEHSTPIPLNHVSNDSTISWIYHDSTYLLENAHLDIEKQPFKLSWLSAKVVVQYSDQEESHEYSMDSFLENLLVKTTSFSPPTFSTLFHSWCISQKLWFSSKDSIRIHVIDENADDLVFHLNTSPTVSLQGNKIYVYHRLA